MKKRITVMNKQEITDDEVRRYMDFDRLLTAHRNNTASSRRRTLKRNLITITIVGIIIFSGVSYFILTKDVEDVQTQKQKAPALPLIEEAKPDKNVQQEQTPIATEKVQEKSANKVADERGKSTGSFRKEPSKEPKDKNGQAAASAPIYIQAEPVDGYPALYAYFNKALKYPSQMVKDSVNGVVVVAFTINAKGTPEHVSIDQSLGKAFDEEAIRLIEGMPQWKPATYNGKAVATRMSVPITFQISGIIESSEKQ